VVFRGAGMSRTRGAGAWGSVPGDSLIL